MQMSKCLMQSHILMWVRNRIYTHAHRLTDTKNARNELTFNSGKISMQFLLVQRPNMTHNRSGKATNTLGLPTPNSTPDNLTCSLVKYTSK